MAVPTTLESLSPTAQTDPAAGDNVSAGDDNLRSAFQLLRQTVTAGSDIASASTITPASTGSSFNLTGVTTVTAIGSTNAWDGRIVWFRHTGAHAFTNSATLVCLGGASITFASGDISAWRQRTSGTWDQVAMFRADGAFLGDSWNVDTSGRLLNNGNTQPSFRATLATDRLTTGTFASFTENHDYGSNFNNTTGVFTAPVAGVYSFATLFGGTTSSGTGSAQVNFYKNGASINGNLWVMSLSTNPDYGSLVFAAIPLAASDTMRVELVVISGTGAGVSCLEFSGCLLG